MDSRGRVTPGVNHKFTKPCPGDLAGLFFARIFLVLMKTISEQAETALIGASNKVTLGGAGTAAVAKAADMSGVTAFLTGYGPAIGSAMAILGGFCAVCGLLISAYFQYRRHLREERIANGQ